MAREKKGRRVFLGKRRSLADQERVYRATDYLEVDLVAAYDVTRRRIFYDEILFVTSHSSIGWGLAVVTGLVGGLLGLASGGMIGVDRVAAALMFVLGSLPLLAVAAWRLLVPAEIVTVFGKRARARMQFWPRRARGRETYLLICRLARERQAQLSRQVQRPTPIEPAPVEPTT